MSSPVIEPVARLIEAFSRLPGIGPKTAQRLTFHLLRAPDAEARQLAVALVAVRDEVVFCERCFNISDAALCPLYPIDKERNADGLRRVRQPIFGATPLPEPRNERDREAPLLRKCMQEYAATGMPFAYVPDDAWPSERPSGLPKTVTMR